MSAPSSSTDPMDEQNESSDAGEAPGGPPSGVPSSSRDSDRGSSALPRAGTLISGKYRVTREIGSGGMGVVLEAEDIEQKQRVAIKCMTSDACEDPDLVERFEREARAASRIKSKHVTRVLDVGKLDTTGAPFIVFEFLEGLDFADYLTQKAPLGISTAVGFVLQACEALGEAHAAGIIHRDIKPANLFVTTDENGASTLKVLDFGVSKLAEEPLTKTSVLLGTATYMSPEQFQSAKTVDARTDIWSLGAVLYEALTGVPAFDGTSAPHVLAKVAKADYARLGTLRENVPERIEAILDKCLRVNPTERYASMAELAAALRIVEQEENAARAAMSSVMDAAKEAGNQAVVVLDEDAGEVSHTIAIWSSAYAAGIDLPGMPQGKPPPSPERTSDRKLRISDRPPAPSPGRAKKDDHPSQKSNKKLPSSGSKPKEAIDARVKSDANKKVASLPPPAPPAPAQPAWQTWFLLAAVAVALAVAVLVVLMRSGAPDEAPRRGAHPTSTANNP